MPYTSRRIPNDELRSLRDRSLSLHKMGLVSCHTHRRLTSRAEKRRILSLKISQEISQMDFFPKLSSISPSVQLAISGVSVTRDIEWFSSSSLPFDFAYQLSTIPKTSARRISQFNNIQLTHIVQKDIHKNCRYKFKIYVIKVEQKGGKGMFMSKQKGQKRTRQYPNNVLLTQVTLFSTMNPMFFGLEYRNLTITSTA